MIKSADLEINIPLATVQPRQVGQPEEYSQVISEAYTGQYLQALGVEPSARHRKLVQRHAPLDKCNIEAVWDDHSAVARNLRITQAPIGRSSSTGRLQDGEPPPPAAPPTVGVDKWHFMSTEMPGGSGQQRENARPGAKDYNDPKHIALMKMKMADEAMSEWVNTELVEELERMRRAARGDGSRGDGDPAFMVWGEEGFRELEALKRKFILPFATVRHGARGQPGPVVPWQSPEYRTRMHIDVTREHVEELSEPISMTLEDISDEISYYNEMGFPLELLTTRRDPWLFTAVRDRLGSPDAVRLTGLLAHLLYWTVFAHLRPPAKRLPQPSMQSLILTVQELWARHCDPAKYRRPGAPGERLAREVPRGLSFLLPVMMLSLKRNVESVFLLQYAKSFADKEHGHELTTKLAERLNVLVMNLLDPDCAYASFGALDSSIEAIKAWKQLNIIQMKLGLTPGNKILGKQFRTKPMMMLLMNGDGSLPENPKTRRLLQKSASDAVLATVSAAVPRRPGSSGSGCSASASSLPLPRMDDQRRKALYRSACGRFKSAGMDVVSCQQVAPPRCAAPAATIDTGTPRMSVLHASIAELAAAAGASAGRAAARS